MILILIAVLFFNGCATGQAIILPGERENLAAATTAIQPAPPPSQPADNPPAEAVSAETADEPATPVNEQDLANQAAASEFLTSGQAHYLRGEDDQAQENISHAINVYPFSAPAHLLMGKILLIRGAARRDVAQLESARLMFKMAVELDPAAEEARQLLDLLTKQD